MNTKESFLTLVTEVSQLQMKQKGDNHNRPLN